MNLLKFFKRKEAYVCPDFPDVIIVPEKYVSHCSYLLPCTKETKKIIKEKGKKK